jgi:uncharacterized damage-inducible protein DinB
MGTRTEALARLFETRAQQAAAVVEEVSDADWQKVTTAEGWTVAATAHHLAGAFEPVAGMAAALAAGQTLGDFTRAMLDEMNAAHARDFARCTKAETLALHRKNTAAAAAVIRGLGDDQLDRRVTVFTDAPPMTVEQFLTGGLLTHIDEHVGSIRTTIGR